MKINNKIINQYKDQSVIDALINNFEEKSSRIPIIKTFKKSLWIPILFFILSMVILYIYNKNLIPVLSHILYNL